MELNATLADAGKRLDHLLQERLPEFSRSRLQSWIKSGRVLVNGAPGKSSAVIHGAESIAVTPAHLPPLQATAEELPIEILYEDEDVIAINKPAGQVVHAGAGNHMGTLVNALVHHFGALSTVGGDLRPGIVHRLDRYTSGVILVARNDVAHRNLAAQFSSRNVEKTYLALVHGDVAKETGSITTPIARDPIHRTRMTTRVATGRTANTHYRVLKRFRGYTYIAVKIGTGRTHQIRVHLSSIGHPVAGDKLYGAPPSDRGRFFLHAAEISYDSPRTLERTTVRAPLPDELEEWLRGL